MKRWIMWFVVLAVALITVAALPAADEVPEPRNVRLRAQIAGDSIYFRLQWNAPPRGQYETPITGYEWELRSGASLGDYVTLAYGETAANDRRVELAVAFDCSQSPTYYVARVRALGSFSEDAPWGTSDAFTMACNDSPPGPPIVDLDTIQVDTSTAEPDSMRLLPVDMGASTVWEPDTKTLRFAWLGDVAKFCGFAFRDERGYLMPRSSWVATMDSTVVTTSSDAIWIRDAAPSEEACWFVTAQDYRDAQIHLCTTDCPVSLAGWLPQLPSSWRWPLVFLGFFLIVIDMKLTRKLMSRLWRRVQDRFLKTEATSG